MRSFSLLLLLLICILSFAQEDSVQLISPSGNHAVGTIVYEWSYEDRIILVQFWYPAEVSGEEQSAPYSALSNDYRNTFTNSYLRPSFSNDVSNAPLVLVAPGRGTERYLYTTIAEELASHGYAVASVDMPGIGYVIYQDGYIEKPSPEFRPPRGMMAGPYERVDSFFERPTAIGLADLEFAMENIKALNKKDPAGRFTGKLHLDGIAIIGHSLGGRIAGKFACENKNVKAYLSMEGIPPRDIRYEGKMKIPIVMLCSSGTWPYARDNYFSLIDNRTNPVYMIELPDFGHNSITDNPYIYPSSFNYAIDPAKGLQMIRKMVLGYVDAQLRSNADYNEVLNQMDGIKFQLYE